MLGKKFFIVSLLFLLTAGVSFAIGEDTGDDDPPSAAPSFNEANIINDEGGPNVVRGEVAYSNPFFTLGTAQPLVILEDQTGFVDRNEYYIIPPESQVLGQITSDFFTSPFTYSIALPQVPQAPLRDVDNDGADDTGVMVFAPAYWSNTFGDPFLEERDLYGGGWSTAYASTRTSNNPDLRGEIIGGSFVIYAPDAQQGFPAGFGEDGLLFTEDDPIVTIPQGYSVVNLDEEPFTFDRSREANLDLLEPEGSAAVSYADLPYTEAFDAAVEKMSNEYAFTEYRDLDWEALSDTYRPRIEQAEADADPVAYALALRDFIWEIPDGHVSLSLDLLIQFFAEQTENGIGIAIRELTDGRIVANFVLEGSPADQAGIELGAEIIAFDGTPVTERMEDIFVWAAAANGTDHTYRLQQLRYVTRFPAGTEEVAVTFRNPGGAEQVITMPVVPERESFNVSSFNVDISGTELPVEFEILPSGYGYVSIYSFSDDEFLTVQLWERMIQQFKEAEVPGIIVDMRNNGGGNGFLATQMAAYFFDEPKVIGNTGYYNEDIDEFFFDERGERRMYLPPEEDRFLGPVAVLVYPSCFSACEFFSYAASVDGRADVVGHYPTGGLGGSIDTFRMPENISIVFTQGRAVNADGEIHIEGKGVAPTVTVPVTEETLLGAGDAVLAAAERALTEQIRGQIVAGGTLAFGENLGTVSATSSIQPEQAVQFEVELPAASIVSFYVGDEAETLDTVMRIYDETGSELLVENDDAESGGVNSALEGLTVGGSALNVIIEVSIKDDQPEGAFFLRIEAVPEE